jgi:hypothetical protein
MEIRKRILESGQPLLETWEDLEREVAERRGGNYGEPKRFEPSSMLGFSSPRQRFGSPRLARWR